MQDKKQQIADRDTVVFFIGLVIGCLIGFFTFYFGKKEEKQPESLTSVVYDHHNCKVLTINGNQLEFEPSSTGHIYSMGLNIPYGFKLISTSNYKLISVACPKDSMVTMFSPNGDYSKPAILN
jgi:hypothetical protein